MASIKCRTPPMAALLVTAYTNRIRIIAHFIQISEIDMLQVLAYSFN